MKTWYITLTHLDLPLVEYSLEQFYKTVTLLTSDEHILIDHHWPIDYWNHRHGILKLAEKYGCKVMSPYQNLGGHGGYNWALTNLPIRDEDIVVMYDGDSNPINPGWNRALVSVLCCEPDYVAVSLGIDMPMRTTEWVHSTTRVGHQVMTPKDSIDMINVTAWRYSFLKQIGLFHAMYGYYGQIEIPMFDLIKQHGKRHGYLIDFKEAERPFKPNAYYLQWKERHVSGEFKGNFDEYLLK